MTLSCQIFRQIQLKKDLFSGGVKKHIVTSVYAHELKQSTSWVNNNVRNMNYNNIIIKSGFQIKNDLSIINKLFVLRFGSIALRVTFFSLYFMQNSHMIMRSKCELTDMLNAGCYYRKFLAFLALMWIILLN